MRDIEQDRIHRPQPRSLRGLITSLDLAEGERQALLTIAASGNGGSALWVGVLGPLLVRRGDNDLEISSPMLRRLLGLLALHAGGVVSYDEIVDVLWAQDPPRSCLNLVHGYLGRLRRLLEAPRPPAAAAVVVRSGAGYRLRLAGERTGTTSTGSPSTGAPPAGIPSSGMPSTGAQLDLAQFDWLLSRALRARDAGQLAQAREHLADALDLWRGRVLAGADERLARHPAAAQAEQRRIDSLLSYADLAIDAREYRAAMGRLHGLVQEHPLHEGLHARLMVALAGCGEQAAALGLYVDVRTRLAEELGVEPGAELQAANLRVLRQEIPAPGQATAIATAGTGAPGAGAPGAGTGGAGTGGAGTATRPAQLPVDVAAFTGRAWYLRRLDALRPTGDPDDPSGDTGRPAAVVISAIAGGAGIGKTALAVHWAHRNRGWFPDGQLYVNLRGFDPSGSVMTPIEATRVFLEALGVPPRRMPATADAQTGLYRSLLADRRMLVVLDNARDAEQVRPLLPGAPGCLVLVTSRNQLSGLIAAEGAQPLNLDLLSPSESRQLLSRRLGPTRVAAELEPVDQIIARCARLPLALAIVAAHAAIHAESSLAALAGTLHDARDSLDAFANDDPFTDVRAVFSWSYRTLRPPAARLFRLLGIHPGPDIEPNAAASLADLPADQVPPLLRELADAHLVTEHLPGRYTFHDLLRAHAAELAANIDGAIEVDAARDRVLSHYVYTAHAADHALEPQRYRYALEAAYPGARPLEITDAEVARSWFAAEHQVLLAAVRLAAGIERDALAGQLAWAMVTFLDRRGHWHDLALVQETALVAARRLGDPHAQADAHRSVGLAQTRLGRYDEAYQHVQRALEFSEQLEDHLGQANAYNNLMVMFSQQARRAEALHCAERSLELYRRSGDARGYARGFNMVGWQHAQLGDHRQAISYAERSLPLLRQIDDVLGEAHAYDTLGYAHHHLGHSSQAIVCYQRSVDLFRQAGNRLDEGATLTRLGDAYATLGDASAAQAVWQQAYDILDRLGHATAQQVHAKLQMLDMAQQAPSGR